MIVTEGGRWGGYGLYLLNGKPVFTYNLLQLLQPRWAGSRRSRRASTRSSLISPTTVPGIAKGGTGMLSVDGQDVHTLTDPAHDPVPDARPTRPSTWVWTPVPG